MLKTIPVLDEIIKDEKFSFQSNLHQWFKAMTFEEYKRIKTLFAELGVDFFVEYVPVGGSGSGNTTEEEYKQFKKYLEEGKISNLSNEQVFSLVKKQYQKKLWTLTNIVLQIKLQLVLMNQMNRMNQVIQ